MGVLKKLFDIRQGEWSRFGLLFAAFFLFNIGMAWAGASTRGVVVAEFGDDFIKYGLNINSCFTGINHHTELSFGG